MGHPEHFGKDRRFVVIQTIGSGGMGTVYLAKDTVLNRVVAIKMPHPNLIPRPNSPLRRRFAQEVAAHGRISHPNVVPLYDFGFETIDGLSVPYMVLEFVGGMEVNDCCEKAGAGGFGPLPAEVAGWILLDVLSALRTMHESGIIHRDIKPANIMVSWDMTSVKVMDFGIARNVDGTDPGVPRETMVMTQMGTRGFMSPEQMADARSVDRRTDIYAAGAVLYQVMTAVAEVPVLSMFELDSPEFQALPEPWRQIAHGATRYKPEDRAYQEAREMAAAVRSALSTATGSTEPFERWLCEKRAASPVERAIRQAFGHGHTIVPSDDDIVELTPLLEEISAHSSVPKVHVGSARTYVHDDVPDDESSVPAPRSRGKIALAATLFLAMLALTAFGFTHADGSKDSTSEIIVQAPPQLPTPSVGSQASSANVLPAVPNATSVLPTPSVGSAPTPATSKPRRPVDPIAPVAAPVVVSTPVQAPVAASVVTTPAPDTGTVHLVGGAVSIDLVGADGIVRSAGRVPTGTYRVRATFAPSSAPVNAIDAVHVSPGQDVSVTCKAQTAICIAR